MHVFVNVSDVMFGWKELVEVGNGGLQFNREERLSGTLLPLLQRNEGRMGLSFYPIRVSGMGLHWHWYGATVAPVWDYSGTWMELQRHRYGTTVVPGWNYSGTGMGLQ